MSCTISTPIKNLYLVLRIQRIDYSNHFQIKAAIPVNAGDVIVGDARLIHGAFPTEERTLIAPWFHPNYNALTPALQSRISEIFLRTGVDTDPGALDKIRPLNWSDENRVGYDFYFP